MWYFNWALTRAFDALLWPFGRWPSGGLLFVSALAGVLMLLIFKKTSDQRAVRGARDRSNAQLLALRLFADDAGVVVASQRAVVTATLGYMRYALVPLVAILPAVILIMIQLNLRYGAAPARVGEPLVVTATFASEMDEDVALAAPAGVRVETEAVRSRGDAAASWRLRPVKAGKYILQVRAAGATYEKELAVGPEGTARVSGRRVRGLWAQLWNPGERPLAGALKEIRVNYPPRQNKIFGLRVSWVVTFFVVSLVAALALKGVLRTAI